MAEERKRLAQIDDRLRGNIQAWAAQVAALRQNFENAANSRNQYAPEWFAGQVQALKRFEEEVNASLSDLTIINQDLVAAKSDAEYREVLVRAWPTNHFLDRLTYLGAAVLGAGGAAYLLVGRDVSFLFWAVGGLLMGWGLLGMRKWETRKWEFYADQFSVDPKYRP